MEESIGCEFCKPPYKRLAGLINRSNFDEPFLVVNDTAETLDVIDSQGHQITFIASYCPMCGREFNFDLKCCPLCGKRPKLQQSYANYNNYVYYVVCEGYEHNVEVGPCNSKEEAYECWNRRYTRIITEESDIEEDEDEDISS